MTEISDPPRSSWAAVLSVAIGTFVIVTSEFLPIGLLSHIADAFDVPAGKAGILVTIPGMMAAIAAPVCTIAARAIDRRLLLLAFTCLVVFSNALMATASSFPIALIARAILGICVGGFWTFAAAVGRKLVEQRHGSRATTIIMAGISIGTVVGVPIGSTLGGFFGWRLAFGSVAGLGLAVMIAQTLLLPRIAIATAHTVRGLFEAATNRKLALAFIAVALAAAGHFAAYTYLEPHLVTDAGVTPSMLGWVLAVYGLAGVAGTYLGELFGRRRPHVGFFVLALVMSIAIAATAASTQNLPLEILWVALWGAAFGAVPVCIQLWTYAADPDRFEASSALIVTVFQISLAAGSYLGGRVADGFGVTMAFGSGATLNLVCGLIVGIALLIGSRPRAAGTRAI
jgi:predicted MFS family arabinose efflux permease